MSRTKKLTALLSVLGVFIICLFGVLLTTSTSFASADETVVEDTTTDNTETPEEVVKEYKEVFSLDFDDETELEYIREYGETTMEIKDSKLLIKFPQVEQGTFHSFVKIPVKADKGYPIRIEMDMTIYDFDGNELEASKAIRYYFYNETLLVVDQLKLDRMFSDAMTTDNHYVIEVYPEDFKDAAIDSAYDAERYFCWMRDNGYVTYSTLEIDNFKVYHMLEGSEDLPTDTPEDEEGKESVGDWIDNKGNEISEWIEEHSGVAIPGGLILIVAGVLIFVSLKRKR